MRAQERDAKRQPRFANRIARPVEDCAPHALFAPLAPAPGAVLPRSMQALHAHRRVLMLQGPMGPFFGHLARHLRRHGAQVRKVHFNGGDECFFDACPALRFTGRADDWPDWLTQQLHASEATAIVLFGQMRPLHRVACDLAGALGVDVFVFEEGYLRPHYVTLECGGVNARSSLPRDLPTLRAARPPRPPRPQDTRARFARRAWHATVYAVATHLGRGQYPHYRHHRPMGGLEAARWMRGGLRKLLSRVTERRLRARLDNPAMHGRYYLVPVQVHSDSQVLHSRFDSIECFMGVVLHSFAEHAPAGTHLVFKHHPMDLSHRDHTRLLARLAVEHGVEGRVHYLHDGHLPTLLQHARGMVTLNSTTALQALHHRCPVLTLGESFYTVEGLVRRDALHEFWAAPGEVDALLFARYRNLVIHETQLNASFHGSCPALAADAGPDAANDDHLPYAGQRKAWLAPGLAAAALAGCMLTLSLLV